MAEDQWESHWMTFAMTHPCAPDLYFPQHISESVQKLLNVNPIDSSHGLAYQHLCKPLATQGQWPSTAISLSQHALAFQARSVVETFNYYPDFRNMHAILNLSRLTKFAAIGWWQPLHHDTFVCKQCMWGNVKIVVVVDVLLLATLPFAPSLTMCGWLHWPRRSCWDNVGRDSKSSAIHPFQPRAAQSTHNILITFWWVHG